MIIFKLISTRIKQNLDLECLKFYFTGENKKKLKILYIIFVFWPG